MAIEAGARQSPRMRPVSRSRVIGPGRRLLFAGFGFVACLGIALTVAFDAPLFLRWLDEVAVFSAAAFILLGVAITLRAPALVFRLTFGLVLYTTLTVISGAANNVSLTEFVVGWRALAQFYLFYLVLVWLRPDSGDLRAFFNGATGAALVHVVLALQQFLSAGARVGFDEITAGFGSGTANVLGYFCALLVIVSLCRALIAGEKRFLLPVIPVQFMWVAASAVGSYLAFAGSAVLAVLASPEVRRFKRLAPLVLIIAAGAGILFQFASVNFQLSATSLLLGPVRASVRSNIDDAGNPGRLQLLGGALGLIAEHDKTLLVGLGTGSVGTFRGVGVVPRNFALLSERTGAAFMSASSVQILSELGLLGLLMAITAFAALWRLAWINWRTVTSRSDRSWSLAFLLLVPFMFLSGFAELGWSFQPIMYPFVALAAYATVNVARFRVQGRKNLTVPVTRL